MNLSSKKNHDIILKYDIILKSLLIMAFCLVLSTPALAETQFKGTVNDGSIGLTTVTVKRTGKKYYSTNGVTIHKIQTVVSGEYKGYPSKDSKGVEVAIQNSRDSCDGTMDDVYSWPSKDAYKVGYTYRKLKDFNRNYAFVPRMTWDQEEFQTQSGTTYVAGEITIPPVLWDTLMEDFGISVDKISDEADAAAQLGSLPPFEINGVLNTGYEAGTKANPIWLQDGGFDLNRFINNYGDTSKNHISNKQLAYTLGLYDDIHSVDSWTIPDVASPDVKKHGDRFGILNAQAWSAKSKIDIKSRFYIRNTITADINLMPQQREPADWRETGEYGRDSAEAYTWHTSDEFDVGKGIPASESMENGYVANKWFGLYKWGWSIDRTVNYQLTYSSCPYTYTYQWLEWVEDRGDDYDDSHYELRSEEQSGTYTCSNVPTTRTGSYYAVTALDAYELQNVNVTNGSYGSADYQGSYKSVPTIFDGQLNYDHVTEYGESWGRTDEDEKHMDHVPGQTYSVQGNTSVNGGHIPGTFFEREPSDSELDAAIRPKCENAAKTDTAAELTVWNDTLTIDGHEYMRRNQQTTTDVSNILNTTNAGSLPNNGRPKSVNYKEVTRDASSGGDFGQENGTQTVEIPAETKNGKYPTTLTATYARILPENIPDSMTGTSGTGSTGDSSASKNSITYQQTATLQKQNADAIYKDFKQNEPVVVHTPVISPVSIKDPEKAVQLINLPATDHDGSPLNWLVLDHTYTVSFDPYQWFSQEFGELKGYENDTNSADRYDKYTLRKTVRFPFPVTIKTGGGKEIYYELIDGYTKWIGGEDDKDNFPDGMDNSFNFYIPTWVQENTSKFGSSTGSAYDIQFRVEAINSDGESDNTTEDTVNSELENHVSTYDICANVSGQIYDFQVVGTDDKDMFSGYSNSAAEKTDYPFALNKEEKKAGTQNRNGGKAVRYTLDGEVTDGWKDSNTIPFRQGVSNVYSDMGTLWKGTKISYSVKTIANLSDTDDEVVITPSFKYVNRDGSVTDSNNIIVYYTDIESGKYIKVAPGRDEKNVKSVSLSNDEFKGSWYQGSGNTSFLWNKTDLPSYSSEIPDNLHYTAARENIKEQELLNRTVQSYTASKIVLNSKLRLLTGDPEQLERNLDKQRNTTGFDNLTGITDIPANIGDITNSDQTVNKEFRDSIQTWYGQYIVPQDLFVYKKTKPIIMPGCTKDSAIPLDTKTTDPGYDKDGDGYFTLAD